MLAKLNAYECTARQEIGGDIELVFTVARGFQNMKIITGLLEVFKAKKSPLSLAVDWYRAKRSLDANAYMWVLCDKIAKAAGTTKEDVYRAHIKDVGVFEPLPIINDAVQRFSESWQCHGTGWVCEVVDDSKLDGYKLVHAYYGSSTYNTEEMNRLIDNVVQDAKSMDIETMTPQELAALMERWDEKQTDKAN